MKIDRWFAATAAAVAAAAATVAYVTFAPDPAAKPRGGSGYQLENAAKAPDRKPSVRAAAPAESADGEDARIAAGRPYSGSNVFVRLPTGEIAPQGTELPPVVAESAEERESREAFAAWDGILGRISAGRSGVKYAEFSKALNRLPAGRRAENLRHAANLMDDSDFALIAALALDRSQPEEAIAAAFDACMNRDCEAAHSAIRKIANDKSHPMYVDAARVEDVKRLGH